MRSALLAFVLASTASSAFSLAGCAKPECRPADLASRDCTCPDGAAGAQACVAEKWAACVCQPAGAPSRLPGVQGAGLIGGGKEVPSEFCKNNCKGVNNTCKASGIGEPGSCEKEFNECIGRCPP
jgi:hypothetical protein